MNQIDWSINPSWYWLQLPTACPQLAHSLPTACPQLGPLMSPSTPRTRQGLLQIVGQPLQTSWNAIPSHHLTIYMFNRGFPAKSANLRDPEPSMQRHNLRKTFQQASLKRSMTHLGKGSLQAILCFPCAFVAQRRAPGSLIEAGGAMQSKNCLTAKVKLHVCTGNLTPKHDKRPTCAFKLPKAAPWGPDHHRHLPSWPSTSAKLGHIINIHQHPV